MIPIGLQIEQTNGQTDGDHAHMRIYIMCTNIIDDDKLKWSTVLAQGMNVQQTASIKLKNSGDADTRSPPLRFVTGCRRILFKPCRTTMLGNARILGGILVGSVVSECRRNRSGQSRLQHWNRHVVGSFVCMSISQKEYNAALKPSIPPAVLVDACSVYVY